MDRAAVTRDRGRLQIDRYRTGRRVQAQRIVVIAVPAVGMRHHVRQRARQAEQVVARQSFQHQHVDARSRHRHVCARRVRQGDIACARHDKRVGYIRPAMHQRVQTATRIAEPQRACRPQPLEAHRRQAVHQHAARVHLRSRRVGDRIRTGRCQHIQQIVPAAAVNHHRFRRRKVHHRRAGHRHTAGVRRRGSVGDRLRRRSGRDHQVIAGRRIAAVHVDRGHASQADRRHTDQIVAEPALQVDRAEGREPDHGLVIDPDPVLAIVQQGDLIRSVGPVGRDDVTGLERCDLGHFQPVERNGSVRRRDCAGIVRGARRVNRRARRGIGDVHRVDRRSARQAAWLAAVHGQRHARRLGPRHVDRVRTQASRHSQGLGRRRNVDSLGRIDSHRRGRTADDSDRVRRRRAMYRHRIGVPAAGHREGARQVGSQVHRQQRIQAIGPGGHRGGRLRRNLDVVLVARAGQAECVAGLAAAVEHDALQTRRAAKLRRAERVVSAESVDGQVLDIDQRDRAAEARDQVAGRRLRQGDGVTSCSAVQDRRIRACCRVPAPELDRYVRLRGLDCEGVVAVESVQDQCFEPVVDQCNVVAVQRPQADVPGGRHGEGIVRVRTTGHESIVQTRPIKGDIAVRTEVFVADCQPAVGIGRQPASQLDRAGVTRRTRGMDEPPRAVDGHAFVAVFPVVQQSLDRLDRNRLSTHDERAGVERGRRPGDVVVVRADDALHRQRVAVDAGIVADHGQTGQRQGADVDIDVVVAVLGVHGQPARVAHHDRRASVHGQFVRVRARPEDLDLVRSVGALHHECVAREIQVDRFDVVIADGLVARYAEPALIAFRPGHEGRRCGRRQTDSVPQDTDRVAAVQEHLRGRRRRHVECVAAR